MKKLITIICSLCLFLSPLQVYAQELETKTSITYEFSELEYFQELRAFSDEELKEKGITQEQIEYIRNFDLVEAIRERASLSESTLKELGYTNEEIIQLKNILNRRNVSEEDVIREVKGATLTLTVLPPSTTSSKNSI